jgi:hypothetical protein
MAYWASTDPKAGADWAARLAPGRFRTSALDTVLLEWADQFPAEAASWSAGQKNAAPLTALVAEAWAKTEPERAARWALTLNDPSARGEAVALVASSWAATDPGEALRWIVSVPDVPLREELQSGALQSWAADDPEAAIAWVQTTRDGKLRARLLGQIQEWRAPVAPEGGSR